MGWCDLDVGLGGDGGGALLATICIWTILFQLRV